MEDVVILDLSDSEITDDWKGWSHMKVMKNLKVLNLTDCQFLETTPDFSAHVNLEHLILQGCSKLVEIDWSICQLIRLVSLDVSGCLSLRRLPEELGGLIALKELRIDGTRIKKIPNCQGMRNLRIFTASLCQRIALPPTIEYLTSLEYLSLEQCLQLKSLPDSIGNLESLIELDIRHTSIRELPDSIGNLKNLKVVRMTCDSTSKIPDSLWTIEKLEVIKAMDPSFTESFPVKIGDCTYRNQSLRILILTGAEIDTVPRLPESLVILELTRLYMKTFPDLSNLTNLKRLRLWFNPPDDDGPMEEDPMPWWIGNLSKLESLSLVSDYVTTLPIDISLLPRLRELDIHCRKLCSLPSLPSSLLFLSLTPCKSFCSIDLSNLKKLLSLHIFDFAISEIRGLDGLENLEELQLFDLQQVEILPNLSNFNKLIILQVHNYGNLVDIQGELPQSLEELKIDSCGSLQQLPNLSSLRGLQRFKVCKCSNLVEIQDMQDKLSQSLEELEIDSCGSLQQLPNLSSLKGLQRFCIRKCGSLVEIQGELPQFLEELEIDSCESLQQLPDLSNLKGLRKVQIYFCWKLNVKAISSLCSERAVEFVGEDDELEGEDYESESGQEDDESESESEGEDYESEFDSEGEDEYEYESEVEDEE